MNKLEQLDIKDNIKLWLDYTISIKFFELFKENSNYTSYLSFCLSIYKSLKSKNDRGFFHISRVMVEFNKVSGFGDELSLLYVIDYLKEKRYEKYYKISKLEYEVKNQK